MLAGSAASLLLAMTATLQSGDVEVGSRPEYRFREDLVNGQGITSLADLAGRPVLVEFWGTH